MTPPFTVFKFPSEFYRIFEDPESDYELGIHEQDAVRKPQVRYIKRYLEELGCQSVLVENAYIDHDFLDDYASYYAKCFGSYKRFCRRAHFWSTDISAIDVPEAVATRDKPKLECLSDSYLGFAVLKPLPQAVIGRTVLKTYDDDRGKRRIRVIRDYQANLFGLTLDLKSLAFQEQDTVLAACATTALWSCFQATSEKFQLTLPTPSQITRSATKYVQPSRSIPSHGLRIEQMCSAISENGLVPEVQTIYPDTHLNSLIYAYASAGLPVVLGYLLETGEQHAVAVCGYRLEDSPQVETETKDPRLDMNLVGRRIKEFYVHDDGLGPFSRLKCFTVSLKLLSKGYNPRLLVREVDDEPDLTRSCLPRVVIVPLYHKIRLRFPHVMDATRGISSYLRRLGIDYVDRENPRGFEWEVRLMELPNIKRKLADSDTIETDVKKALLTSNLPRFLWVSSALVDRRRQFSLVADATDIERSFYFSHFVSHVPDLKAQIASRIEARDPNLSAAAEAGLPAAFQRFIREQILK